MRDCLHPQGGKVVVRTVSALSELYTAPTSSGAGAGAAAGERFSAPELVVNCTGLGAALLDDVRDKNLYPVRSVTPFCRCELLFASDAVSVRVCASAEDRRCWCTTLQ